MKDIASGQLLQGETHTQSVLCGVDRVGALSGQAHPGERLWATKAKASDMQRRPCAAAELIV